MKAIAKRIKPLPLMEPDLTTSSSCMHFRMISIRKQSKKLLRFLHDRHLIQNRRNRLHLAQLCLAQGAVRQAFPFRIRITGCDPSDHSRGKEETLRMPDSASRGGYH
jgi:hypothetical protein